MSHNIIIVVILFTYVLHTLIADVTIVYLYTQHIMVHTAATIIVCTSALASSNLYLFTLNKTLFVTRYKFHVTS